MKTLKRFWHWVDNEKPEPLTAAGHAHRVTGKTLSPDAISALEAAALHICSHVRPHAKPGSTWHMVYYCFGTDAKRQHLRNLSLALCPVLTRMHDELAVELGTPEEQERAKEPPKPNALERLRGMAPLPKPNATFFQQRHRVHSESYVCNACSLLSTADPSVRPRADGWVYCDSCENNGRKKVSAVPTLIAPPGSGKTEIRVRPIAAAGGVVTCPACGCIQSPLSKCANCKTGFFYYVAGAP